MKTKFLFKLFNLIKIIIIILKRNIKNNETSGICELINCQFLYWKLINSIWNMALSRLFFECDNAKDFWKEMSWLLFSAYNNIFSFEIMYYF